MEKIQQKHGFSLGNSIIENAKFIKRLARTKSTSRRTQIIYGASTDQLLALVETALNVIKAKQPFWTRQILPLNCLAFAK
jgi:NifU-like protein involved in Fe-S cluster formation